MCGHRLEPRQEAGPSASAYPTEVCRVALSLQCLHCQGQCWQLSAAPVLECVDAVSAPIIVCAAVVTRCRLARRCKLADQAVTARARAGALSVQWRGCADRRRGARQVLPGFLFLGSYDNASRTEVLKTLGITHVLNVRADAPQPPQPAHAVPPSLASPAGPARRQHANVRPQTVLCPCFLHPLLGRCADCAAPGGRRPCRRARSCTGTRSRTTPCAPARPTTRSASTSWVRAPAPCQAATAAALHMLSTAAPPAATLHQSRACVCSDERTAAAGHASP